MGNFTSLKVKLPATANCQTVQQLPKIFDMNFKFFHFQQVSHGKTVQESMCTGTPIDI